EFEANSVVRRQAFEDEKNRLEKAGKRPPTALGLETGAVFDDRFTYHDLSSQLTKEAVKILDPGDSKFKANSIVTKKEFEEVKEQIEKGNKRLPKEVPADTAGSVKVEDPGDSKFKADAVISKEEFEEEKKQLEKENKKLPVYTAVTPPAVTTRYQ